jgi:uncharacterized membrane protein
MSHAVQVSAYSKLCNLRHQTFLFFTGDTSASEIGILSSSSPLLVTTGRRVPPGTNGAVTLLGTVASAVAGAATGTSFGVCELLLEGSRAEVVLNAACIGALAGLFGSVVDSLLGASLQYSALEAKSNRVFSSKADAEAAQGSRHISGKDVLSNAQVGRRCSCGALVSVSHAQPQVNFVAASVTSVIFALAAAKSIL